MTSNVRYIDESTRARPISATVNEAKTEFQRFAQTRIAMLQAELKEKKATLKASAPMLVVGGLLAITAFWVLTSALIALLYVLGVLDCGTCVRHHRRRSPDVRISKHQEERTRPGTNH
jgi:uncharacterized membrane protein YqjE